MQAQLEGHPWMKMAVPHTSLGAGMGWGIIGGLVATIVLEEK